MLDTPFVRELGVPQSSPKKTGTEVCSAYMGTGLDGERKSDVSQA
jgi:hypothetical protein